MFKRVARKDYDIWNKFNLKLGVLSCDILILDLPHLS
jgi:hypothetical protein